MSTPLEEAASAVQRAHATLKAAYDRYTAARAERDAAETALLLAQREADCAERALVEAASPRVVVVTP